MKWALSQQKQSQQKGREGSEHWPTIFMGTSVHARGTYEEREKRREEREERERRESERDRERGLLLLATTTITTTVFQLLL